ncbi:MAG: glycosyltransferase [Pseudomonadota bacterium]
MTQRAEGKGSVARRNLKSTCIVVLGMHRSGTSPMTRVLNLLGAERLANVMAAAVGNATGHWEPQTLLDYHNSLLTELGSIWRDWQSLDLTVLPPERRKEVRSDLGQTITEEYGDAPRFVIKDPSICRFVRLYIDLFNGIEIRLVPILTVRDPLEVIASLETRRQMWPEGQTRAGGALLWLRHVLDAEYETRDLARLIIPSKAIQSDWRTAISGLDRLEIPFPALPDEVAEEIDDFVRPELRHHAHSSKEVALNPLLGAGVDQTYAAVRQLVRRPGSKWALADLDAVRTSFDRSTPILSGLIEPARERATAAQQAVKQLQATWLGAETARSELNARLVEFEPAQQRVRRQAEASENACSLAEEEIRRFTCEREAYRAALRTVGAQLHAPSLDRNVALAMAEALRGSISDLEIAFAKSRQKVDEKSRAHAQFAELLEHERQERSALSVKFEELRAHTSSIRGDIKRANARIDDLAAAAQNRAERFEKARNALAEHDGDHRDLETLIEANALHRTKDRMALKRALSCFDLLTGQLATLEQDLRSGAIRLTETEVQLARAKTQSSRHSERANRAEKELMRLAEQVQMERSRGDVLAARNAELQAAIASQSHLWDDVRKLEGDLWRRTREVEIAQAEFDRAVHEYRNSTSWKLTSPLRALSRGTRAIARYVSAAPAAIRLGGGGVPTLRKAMCVYRREGSAGIAERVRRIYGQHAGGQLRMPTPSEKIALSDETMRGSIAGLRFTPIEVPEVSVIVPIYNQLDYTLRCLKSLQQLKTDLTFEVIVMDDGSWDQSELVLSAIDGLRYVRNPENLGFLRNCNKGSTLARGRYLVFLNNDTEVDPNWLTAMHATFKEHGDVGLSGSKLIYPDGRLQEAGGVIWDDASAWNWGRLKDPAHPIYNYARDADYVSGASIMIERDLFEKLNRFDERYKNAYYEDTDLAMAVRQAGLRVMYQPKSVVVHHEGISSGTDEAAGIKRFQAVNRDSFRHKWADALGGFWPNGTTPYLASDRRVVGHVLIIDACTPTPDQDSGSIDMLNLIRILISLGYRVHFIPQTNFAHFDGYTDELQKMGVECVYAPYYRSVDEYLSERGDMFDHVILARITVAHETIEAVMRICAKAQLVFYTVDLHFLREQREAEFTRDNGKIAAAAETKRRELAIMDKVNATIVLSEAERTHLLNMGKTNIHAVPLIREAVEPADVPFEARNGVLFIGGYQHPPNTDAVDWLCDEIWPEVRRLCADKGTDPITLHIYGSKMPDRFSNYEGDDVKVHGYVNDLAAAFSEVQLSVAPLRYGAGLKGKIATSFGYGVPVVGTTIAFEGISNRKYDLSPAIAETPADIAARIVEIVGDPQLWLSLSMLARSVFADSYQIDRLAKSIEQILSHSPQAR